MSDFDFCYSDDTTDLTAQGWELVETSSRGKVWRKAKESKEDRAARMKAKIDAEVALGNLTAKAGAIMGAMIDEIVAGLKVM